MIGLKMSRDKLCDWENLLKLIQQRKVSIETHQFGHRPFLKSLWLKFANAYIRFRAVRDYEFFQEVYRSKLISLRLGDGKIVSYPMPLEDIFNEALYVGNKNYRGDGDVDNNNILNKFIVKYGDLMVEIKNRTSSALNMLGRDDQPVSVVNLESAALQIRKVIECTMHASVVVNIDKISNDLTKEWNANKLMARVEKINPNYYPQPVKLEINKGVKAWVPDEGFISKADFKTLYNKIGELAHAKSPFNNKKVDVQTAKQEMISALRQLIKLLNHHFVPLPDGKSRIVCVMEDGKGGVQTTYWKAI